MFRFIPALVFLAAPALAITPGKVPAPGDTAPPAAEAMLPFIALGFARTNCALPLEGGQAMLAEAMAGMLHTTGPALRDPDGPWTDSIQAAFAQLRQSGRTAIDEAAGTIVLRGCRD